MTRSELVSALAVRQGHLPMTDVDLAVRASLAAPVHDPVHDEAALAEVAVRVRDAVS